MTTEPQDPTAELMNEICQAFEQPCDHAKIRALLDAGGRVDATDKDGETPLLQCIIWARDVETARMLIEAGSPLEAKNCDGLTALTSAAWQGRTAIALALIAAGAKTNEKDNKGNSALLLAVNSQHAEISAALIESGADIDAGGLGENLTPLMVAIIHNMTDIGMRLLEKGCDIDAVRANRFQDTALSLADETGSPLAPVIRMQFSCRALAEHQSMVEGLGTDMHAGTQQPVILKPLRFKLPARSFLRL